MGPAPMVRSGSKRVRPKRARLRIWGRLDDDPPIFLDCAPGGPGNSRGAAKISAILPAGPARRRRAAHKTGMAAARRATEL